jgi:glycosyltransferase involved in cell wall biosynthesis
MLKISVIVTTYNRPEALTLVLQALAAQEYPCFPQPKQSQLFTKHHQQSPFEVIIADDGSSCATTRLIRDIQPYLPYPLRHVWQENQGFRAAKIRNRAIAAAQGNYLIFLDGDCIPLTDFISKHSQLAESDCFVTGNRILLSKNLTEQVIHQQLPVWYWHSLQWLLPYFRHDINRLSPLIRLPDSFLRKYCAQTWQGAKTCNLAVWREAILKVNGFNEEFQGWGYEDADLVVRLLSQGVRRKEGRFAVPVFHLWHPPTDRSQEQHNRQRLFTTLQQEKLHLPILSNCK